MLVLTGGPCAGKSSVIDHLRSALPNAAFVPESATILLAGGYPVPGREIEYSPTWRHHFQGAILELQLRLENFWLAEAERTGKELLVLDRGVLDGAAYLEGGVREYTETYGVDLDMTLQRYCAIYHLESLATGNPANYGTQGNADRMESLEEATKLELSTRKVWSAHPRHNFIAAEPNIDRKAERVFQQVLADLTSLG